jgi:hypothetical protein
MKAQSGPDGGNKRARRALPGSLSLERFAGGKDGKVNAYKKKQQGTPVSYVYVRPSVLKARSASEMIDTLLSP